MTNRALRAEVDAAVDEAYQHVGPKGVDKQAIVQRFLDRGASRASLYRWIDARIETGKPGAALVRSVRRARATTREAVRMARKRGQGEHAVAIAEVAGKALATAPILTRADTTVITATKTVDALEQLHQCIEIGRQLIAFARKEDGSVKLSRTLLAASEHMRRTVETLVKTHEAIHSVSRADDFHRAVIGVLEKVAREDSKVGQLLTTELRTLCDQWAL